MHQSQSSAASADRSSIFLCPALVSQAQNQLRHHAAAALKKQLADAEEEAKLATAGANKVTQQIAL